MTKSVWWPQHPFIIHFPSSVAHSHFWFFFFGGSACSEPATIHFLLHSNFQENPEGAHNVLNAARPKFTPCQAPCLQPPGIGSYSSLGNNNILPAFCQSVKVNRLAQEHSTMTLNQGRCENPHLSIQAPMYWPLQALGFHANDHFWYGVITMIQKKRNWKTICHRYLQRCHNLIQIFFLSVLILNK